MKNYKIGKLIGQGTYGSVYMGKCKSTGEKVAIKKFKKETGDHRRNMQLREIEILQKLEHPNIVKLIEVFEHKNETHLVLEYLEQNLLTFIRSTVEPIPEYNICKILYEILQALSFMHKKGYFHRDLKPENILVSGEDCKIADFGFAKAIGEGLLTEYISTRWYRAPEAILRSPSYNESIDIFALGCIMAEMYNLTPFAPGKNESDQLYKLCLLLGTPDRRVWRDGHKLAQKLNYTFPECPPVAMRTLVKNICYEGIQLLEKLLLWDPNKRPSAEECLRHQYFKKFGFEYKISDLPQDKSIDDEKHNFKIPHMSKYKKILILPGLNKHFVKEHCSLEEFEKKAFLEELKRNRRMNKQSQLKRNNKSSEIKYTERNKARDILLSHKGRIKHNFRLHNDLSDLFPSYDKTVNKSYPDREGSKSQERQKKQFLIPDDVSKLTPKLGRLHFFEKPIQTVTNKSLFGKGNILPLIGPKNYFL